VKCHQKYAMDNLYSPIITAADEIVPHDAELLRHVAALRLRDGEHVRVLNGKGLVARCTVRRLAQQTELLISEYVQHERPHERTLALGVLDNRDRFEFAVEKVTELGITRIVPLLCDHSQHVRTSTERLRSKAIAALTQSGNPWLPSIDEPTPLHNLVCSGSVILGDAEGQPPGPLTAGPLTFLVGPEGGFSQRELDYIHRELKPITWRIGSNRLRAETAAIALVANSE
jgi:16S rRNA (uracil1498-N3)-methyltransferase